MKKPPLRLEFEPDEYLCTWHLRDKNGNATNLSGSIDIAPMQPPKGVFYGQLPVEPTATPSGETSFRFPQRTNSPLVRATLANGGQVLILDAAVTLWASHGTIHGSAALMRRSSVLLPWQHPDDQATQEGQDNAFARVRFQVGALDAVLGFAPIESIRFPKPGETAAREWSATARDSPSVEWASHGDTIEAHYRGKASIADPYSFSVRHSPVVTVEPNGPQSLRSLLEDWVKPVQAIASIATGKSEPLTYLAVHPSASDSQQGPRWHQVFRRGVTQEPFESNADLVRDAGSALACVAQDVDLLDLVHKWQVLAAEHHPLIETYAAMLHAADQHPRSRFLLLVQSLEGMRGHETQDDFDNRTAAHVELRQAALEAIKSDVGAEHFKFVKTYLAKQPFRSLESALRATFEDLPVDRSDDLATTVLVRQLVAEGAPGFTVFAAVARLRNYLAHGVRGFDEAHIREVVTVLETVVRAHALRLLGCPDLVLERVLEP